MVHGAENCGFSAVAAHQQGRRLPCRTAEAVFHGPDCLDHRGESPVALAQVNRDLVVGFSSCSSAPSRFSRRGSHMETWTLFAKLL